MKFMWPMNRTVEKVCGYGEKRDGIDYRMSKHVISYAVDGGKCYLHTMTEEIILVDDNEPREQLENDLISHRFLVPITFDECEYVDKIREILRILSAQKPVTHFTVLTTTDCNARCYYCYELGRNRIFMTEDTAHETARYIMTSSNGKEVSIRWFGGEPLYNMDAIRTICRDLNDSNIKYSSSMVTNGLYLTDDVIEEAIRSWHLKKVQITLDGTKDRYNKTKAYIDNCNNPFGVVLNNINNCLNAGIKVFIRLNIDQDNGEEIIKLCEDLHQQFAGNKNMSIYPAIIKDFHNGAGKSGKSELDLLKSILQKTADYSVRKPERFHIFRVNQCMADDDSSEVIAPDGRIGKCEHFSESEFIGHIKTEQKDIKMLEQWKEKVDKYNECSDCPLYPSCIHLKKCEWTRFSCTEADRLIKYQRFENMVKSILEKSRISVISHEH